MTDLLNVWPKIERLLTEGLSVIPVRDRPEIDKKGIQRPAKTPYGQWKQYQSTIIQKEYLYGEMERFGTSAVATLTGAVSGNLEAIDIDVKYKPGIDARIFTDLGQLYPDLLSRLRINRTPSGGFHILYRVSDSPVPGNAKLAGRPSTAEELAIDPKTKFRNFIETRGEGGFVVAPPSLNYSDYQSNPIPVITWVERCSLIELCKGYTEIITIDKPFTPSAREIDYYDSNPFEDYNNSAAASDLLLHFGWQLEGQNSQFVWFTRPGKDSGVSASFNLSSRLYYFWTTSTDFESQKWKQPATVLGELKFDGDKKKTFKFLVDSGFGKVKSKNEKNALKRAALNRNANLPENFSPEAKEELKNLIEISNEKHPHGIFWYEDEEDIKINRERLYVVSAGLGFRLFRDQICLIENYMVHKVTEREYFDKVKSYIKEDDIEQYENICNAYESFLQRSGKFTVSRLPIIGPEVFFKSSKTISYKFYANGILKITGETIELIAYDQLEAGRLIWADQIRDRDFETVQNVTSCLYYQFLDKAIGVTDYLYKIIGHLAHEFKDEENGYIVILSEVCENPKDGGGSGKNIFASLFGRTTSFKNVAASQLTFDKMFLNSWRGERIFSISDLKRHFDFEFMKEPSSGSGTHKILFKDEISVDSSEMPKFILSTNYSYDVSDGGLKRRIRAIEFTDFFTKAGGVKKHFGVMFPEGWSTEDWKGFDNIIANSIQLLLANDNTIPENTLTASGWAKQFDIMYSPLTRQFIEENVSYWQEEKTITISEFTSAYNKFCSDNNVGQKFSLSSIRMNQALQQYCDRFDIDFSPSVSVKDAGGIVSKCKIFGVPF